jgi:glutamate/tyrosine decarboxylase-like PLP-dependent enzyme
LIERCCELARLAAEGLKAIPGVEVLNEVVLNQVLFRFAEDERTNAALAEVQRAGLSGSAARRSMGARQSASRSAIGRATAKTSSG